MLKTFMFMLKNKILKSPENLSYCVKDFFKLSKKNQRKVLDKYFKAFSDEVDVVGYFMSNEARYYENEKEINMFSCYYFDKLLIEHDIYNIRYIDKFTLDKEKQEYLINYALYIIKEEKVLLDIKKIVKYTDELPSQLSNNIAFMSYLIKVDCYNVKYLTYNEFSANKVRELIYSSIIEARNHEFDIKKFLKQDGTLPSILAKSVDFILYLVSNDLDNVEYLTDQMLSSQTISSLDQIVKTIIDTLINSGKGLDVIEKNEILSSILNRNERFISYIIQTDISNIRYVDWHNLTDSLKNNIINYIVSVLRDNNIRLNIMKYPFRDIFFQNFSFMKYLMEDDCRWISVSRVNSREESDKLIDLYFKFKEQKKFKFRLIDFLEDGEYINHYLLENKKMFNYIYENNQKMVKHINFFNLERSKVVVENLVNELEKNEYVFDNDDYLVNGRYPIILSNNYRFMRYVIYKNFNYLAYIDTSCIERDTLKRIINYAFRTVYYIRGNDRRLSFDIDGYFRNSMIIDDEYFLECLKCL